MQVHRRSGRILCKVFDGKMRKYCLPYRVSRVKRISPISRDRNKFHYKVVVDLGGNFDKEKQGPITMSLFRDLFPTSKVFMSCNSEVGFNWALEIVLPSFL